MKPQETQSSVCVCVCVTVYFTCLQVTFSRSWQVMMLLSLALIRHSVLSLTEGLPKMKPHKNLSTHTVTVVQVCHQQV